MKKIIQSALGILLTILTTVSAQTKSIPLAKTAIAPESKWLLGQTNVSGTKFVEENPKNKEIGNIAYKKYQLANGLIILVHEDHSDPICHVDVTYHVGSNREELGRSGFAHFFEHMMFQGSDNVADEQHFKIVSEAGGTLNGTTNKDRTNYFETMPNNQLEIGLWLEADRMGFLVDAVTQQKFEVQRATVKNERGQRYDNAPYGLVDEKTNKSLYPYGHPYSWSTIGDLEDLNRVDVNDLKSFFLRWYGPNNAVLTVVGDVNAEKVVKLAEKYFGPILRCPEVKNLPKMPAKLEANRFVSYEDNNIRFPQVSITWPTVEMNNADMYALDALANILGQTQTSLLYQKFVKTQQAMQASSYAYNQELAGIFNITLRGLPGKSLKDYEKAIRETLVEFEKNGVTDDDVTRFIATMETNTIQSLSSVSGKASILAANQTFMNEPNHQVKDLANYKRVTKEEVLRVFNQYIKDKPAVIFSCVPKGKKELIVAEDNYTSNVADPNDADHKEYQGLTYKKAKDTFDRSKKPSPGPNPFVKVPEYTTTTETNGMKVISSKNDEIPMVTMQLYVGAGHRLETKDKAGLANLLSDMMNECSQNYTAEQRSEILEKLGADVSVYCSNDDIFINISTPTKNVDATLKIAEDVILHPKFDAVDFDRVKNQTIEQIANQSSQPVTIANNVYTKLLYGNESVLGTPLAGTQKTVDALTLEDVKNFYNNNFKPNIATLVITGDFQQETIAPKLKFLTTNWTGVAKDRPEIIKPINNVSKTKIYLVDKEKAPQSEIRIGYVAMPYDVTGEFFKSKIMNFTLGGAFNSRINLNLREKRGFTYGARSGFNGGKFGGSYTASAGVKAENTDSSIVEFMKEIKNFADKGISDEELAFTKNSLSQADALKYETAYQKAGFLKQIVDYNLTKDFVDQQAAVLKNITKQEVDALAKKNLPYNKMVIVTVSDKKSNIEKLKKLGYDIVEVDTEGNILLSQGSNGSRKEGY